MEILLIARVALLIFFASFFVSTEAEAQTTGSISYLHGDGYASGDNTRNTIRFDVLNLNKYGLLYGRADNTSMDDGNSQTITRILGHLNIGYGLHLAVQSQNQARSSATSVGFGYDLISKPITFGLDINRLSSNFYGDSTHLFSFWRTDDLYGFYTEGHLDYIMPDHGQNVLFAQPSIMYKTPSFESLSFGLEYQIYENKSGIRGLQESVPQFKLKYLF